jgi:SAM-dependent methyltransferase
VNVLDRVHERVIVGRRARVLAGLVSERLPERGSVLDIGAGDGSIAVLVSAARPGLELAGVDVLVREQALIPVEAFDGLTIPFGDSSFDAAMLVDVLHHAEDPRQLLHEAARVAPVVVVKDHLADRALAGPMLRFMDRVGNSRHGVELRYEYWRRQQWRDAIKAAGLTEVAFTRSVPLYPPPLSWVFGGGLHFVARLERR